MRATTSATLIGALSLASLAALASERGMDPPAAQAAAHDLRTATAEPIKSKVGPWNRGSVLDPVRPAEQAPVGPSSIPLMLNRDQTDRVITPDRKVALRLNDGLDHLGAELVPALADYTGVEHIDVINSKSLWSGSFLGCHYDLTLEDVFVEMPFGSTSVTGDFQSGSKVLSRFNLPGANSHAELHLAYCWGNPQAEFDVGDLDGNVDVTLKTGDSRIQVDTIDDIDMSVADFSWDTNSDILDLILDLGVSLYDIFDFSCSGAADCLTETINRYALSDDDYLDEMISFVNDLIATPLTISSGGSTDGLLANFNVSLAELKTSTGDNTLTTLWDTSVTSSAPVNSCASALTAHDDADPGTPGDAQLTPDDMELEIPFNILSQVAYYAGKQGLFCQQYNFFLKGVSYPIKIVPNGAVTVAKGTGADPDNLIKFSLPVKATGSGPGVTGSITGTLTIKGTVAVESGSNDMVFTTTGADVSSLSGTLFINKAPYSAAALEPTIDAAAARIVTAMNDIELLNAVADIGDLGLRIVAHDLTTNGKALVIGLNID